MATTIYGCVNRSTGEIDFEVCNPADFSGCIERTGIHAGQVKLTISGTYCDDTYYGCVNRSTGKFQIIVPNDCCCECEYEEEPTSNCDFTLQPSAVILSFSGIQPIDGCEWPSDPNRPFCVGKRDSDLWLADSIDGWEMTLLLYGIPCDNRAGVIELKAAAGDNEGKSAFATFIPSCTIGGAWSNSLPEGTCGESGNIDEGQGCHIGYSLLGHSGTCHIINPCGVCQADIWVIDHSYVLEDVVKLSTEANVCYICIFPHTSSVDNVPPNPVYWEEL